jgi:hypothetical protein
MTQAKKRVAIFASGTGSNFQALADDDRLKEVMTISKLVCDKPGAPVVTKAQSFGIDCFVFSPKDYANKAQFEATILEAIEPVDLIILAGYMRIVSPYLLEHYKGPMINLHPSLLPKYKGVDAIGQAYRSGDSEIGISVHYVNEELDSGQVIAQASLQHPADESLEDLTHRIHDLEHELLPQVVYQLLTQE